MIEYIERTLRIQQEELYPFFLGGFDVEPEISEDMTVSMRYDRYDPNVPQNKFHQPFQEMSDNSYIKESVNQLISGLPHCVLQVQKNMDVVEKNFSEKSEYHVPCVNRLVEYMEEIIDTGKVRYIITGPKLYQYVHYWLHQGESFLDRMLDNKNQIIIDKKIVGFKGSNTDCYLGEKKRVKFFKYHGVDDMFFVSDQLANFNTVMVDVRFGEIKLRTRVYQPRILRLIPKFNDVRFLRERKLTRVLKDPC